MSYGVYEVTENHTYRGHFSGEVFEARIDRNAERRAINRGVIRFVDFATPELVPGSYTFPEGWLAQPKSPKPPRPERASFIGKE